MTHLHPVPSGERHRRRAIRRARRAVPVAAVVAWVVTVALTAGACAAPAPSRTSSGAGATAPSASGSTSPASPARSATPSPAASRGPQDRPDLAELTGRLGLEEVVTGLASPLWVTGAGDGSGRLFVAEQGGRVLVLRDAAGSPETYLDLGDRVRSNGEQGLLGLAFAPGFGVGGEDRLYLHYSGPGGETTLAEVRASAGTGAAAGTASADLATLRVLLVEPQPYVNHNGGWIGFDRDGMLLLGLGDGGSGGDPENRASDTATILGKILRLDVLGGGADGRAYGIPADNPFVSTPGARPEILHLGLRNPFRASVDPLTGTLWIGDVGQGDWEEVDAAPAPARGLDFGWRRWEGRHCFNPQSGCDPAGVTMPVTEYSHAEGCSVIGGVVYQGEAIPALRGAYLFSDYCTGTLWALDAGLDAAQAPIELLKTGRQVSSIGTDDAGEVWITDLGGALLRLVPGA